MRTQRDFPLFYKGGADNTLYTGKQFAAVREAWGINSYQIAKHAGISIEALTAWETRPPRKRMPTMWKTHLIPQAHEGLGEAIIEQMIRILRDRPPRSKLVRDALLQYARDVIGIENG